MTLWQWKRYGWVFLLAGLPGLLLAGGSNYGIAPGARAQMTGRVMEWPIPNAHFPLEPTVAPDGRIFITLRFSDRIARFDPVTQTFTEWHTPAGSQPHGLVVDHHGIVWYTGSGNGTLGRLDPQTGQIRQYHIAANAYPHTPVLDANGNIWFTEMVGNRIGHLETATGRIREYHTHGSPYGIAIDRNGAIWFCEFTGGRLGRLDPATGRITEISAGAGAHPRRMVFAPDGNLYVTLYARDRVLQVAPGARRVRRTYALPGGPAAGPYAITADGAGRIYTSEVETATILQLMPRTGAIRTFRIPSGRAVIRNMSVDQQGRLWYAGSANGRLGMVD